ncbi:hypothetical protein VHEMI00056 [[Torrubiella] hemipterigena]|uniref:Peptidase S1 domain-containing protein n=1 Tax=[Torrubiella] hemipterigena TaxID=1531966 RepID=A0A0A1SPB9_9HYPO|nr:hypothetical protein VHEMI00056 [[Torrubiella] hemipterigena]
MSREVKVGSATRDAGSAVAVKEINRHPKFVQNSKPEYDIAILRLKDDVKFTDSIKAIGLASTSPAVGTKGRVSGWGRKDDGVDSTTLRDVYVPVISNKDCQKYVDAEGITISNRTFCALETGKGPCQGDSGGPFAVDGKLAGIVSGGNECGDAKSPSQYTDIANKDIRDWIRGVNGF